MSGRLFKYSTGNYKYVLVKTKSLTPRLTDVDAYLTRMCVKTPGFKVRDVILEPGVKVRDVILEPGSRFVTSY